MKSRAPSRRPGYSPTDSSVGRRGLDTRERILQSATAVFVEVGYDAASTEAIARAAGTSRATVYQYFASKRQIFEEFMHSCERDVATHAAALHGLGPDEDGARALADWLQGWERFYDKHLVVMAEFPGIGTTEGVIEDPSFVASYITDSLALAGIHGLDALTAAVALLRIIHAANQFRVRGVDLPRASHYRSEGLAVAIQYLLFPDTPATEIADLAPPPTRHVARRQPHPTIDQRTTDLTDPTVRAILDAAATLFADHGYHRVGADDIYRAAKISRASFYRFFRGKSEVLGALTDATTAEFVVLADSLQAIADLPDDHPREELRRWFVKYTRFHHTHRGIIRAWFDPAVRAQVDVVVAPVNARMWNALADLIDKGNRPAATMHPTTAIVVFLSVLVRMTEPISTTLGDPRSPDPDQTAELMTTIADRALLGWSDS